MFPTLLLTWHGILKTRCSWQKEKKTVRHVWYFDQQLKTIWSRNTSCSLVKCTLFLFKVSLWIQHLFVCLIRVVRRVMLLSRCVQLTVRSWRPSTATSAAWRNVMWRCLRAPLRRWTSCWWGGRSTGAASRRRHVSYDVSAAGLWVCFSQLCVRVGGASRLPVFSPFSHSFTYSFMVGVLSTFPA